MIAQWISTFTLGVYPPMSRWVYALEIALVNLNIPGYTVKKSLVHLWKFIYIPFVQEGLIYNRFLNYAVLIRQLTEAGNTLLLFGQQILGIPKQVACGLCRNMIAALSLHFAHESI